MVKASIYTFARAHVCLKHTTATMPKHVLDQTVTLCCVYLFFWNCLCIWKRKEHV